MKSSILNIIFSLFALASFAQGTFDYKATADGTNTYTATILVPTFPTSYIGTEIRLTFTNGNTDAATINISRSTGAIGPAPIRKWDGDSFEALVPGDIPAGGEITIRYNTAGSYFIMDSFGKGSSGVGGTVTSVSVTSANGVSGSVATATTTPAITLSLGAITPTSVNGVTVSGSSTPTLAVTGTTTISGTNTGDQTSITGNAGTATSLQTARTINGVSFNGTSNITLPDQNVTTRNRLPSVTKTASFTLAKSDTSKMIVLDGSAAMTITLADFNTGPNMQFAFVRDSTQIDTVYFNAGGQSVQFSGGKGIPPEGFAYISYSQTLNKFFVSTGGPSSSGGGGSVNSVTGTANRVTIGGTSTDPTVDIASAYVGQSSITTLGTIGTGVWNGTAILGQYGGTGVANTGKTITVSGNTTIGSSTHTVAFATGANTSVTLPSSGTLATLAGSESLTNKKFGSLTSNGLVTTSGGDGTPSITVPGTGALTALALNTNASGGLIANPMTTAGDVLYGAASGVATRLATGTGFLKAGTTPSWASINLAADVGSSDLPYANLTQGSARSILGVTGNSTADVASIQSSAAGQHITSTGTSIQWSEISIWSLFKNVTTGSSVTGTTSETKAASTLVTGGTLDINDIVTWRLTANKVNNNGTMTIRLYINDTDDLTTPTLWGTFTTTSNTIYTKMSREITFKGSISSQRIASETTTLINDYSSAFNTTPLNSTVDFSTDQYFIMTIQLANSADVASIDSYYAQVND
jgi:hypothetical protein